MNKGKEKCCFEEEIGYEPEEIECKPHPKPHKVTEVILNCGTVTGSTPLTFNNGPCGPQPVVQASVALDTIKLFDPTVKIDFSALISFKTNDDEFFLHLGFKLSKICAGNHIPLGIWVFEKGYNENYGGNGGPPPAPPMQPPSRKSLQETDSFSFSWCECDDCPGCCRYIVELIDQHYYNIEYAVVTNIALSAMAVGEKKPY